MQPRHLPSPQGGQSRRPMCPFLLKKSQGSKYKSSIPVSFLEVPRKVELVEIGSFLAWRTKKTS